MKVMFKPLRLGVVLIASLAAQASWADSVVWSCSRSEPQPEVFEKLRAYRIEDLSAKDDDGIVITLSDLYNAYGGQTINMGRAALTVCTLPSNDPIQGAAMELLGYSPKDVEAVAQLATSKLVLVPTIHRMQKCIVENHPAIGFFENVVENARVGPCF
ncbi:MAG: hypothetical protein RI914_275 [Pseudomonadota bacterium]|jgi:hypothetical protein